MKILDALLENSDNQSDNALLSPEQIRELQTQLATLPTIMIIKLIKDIEDAKRGGDEEWRQLPSDVGFYK